MLGHSYPIKTFPTFCRILEVVRVKWRNSTLWFASLLEERKTLNIKYIIFFEWESNPQSAFTVAHLCTCTTTSLKNKRSLKKKTKNKRNKLWGIKTTLTSNKTRVKSTLTTKTISKAIETADISLWFLISNFVNLRDDHKEIGSLKNYWGGAHRLCLYQHNITTALQKYDSTFRK